MRKAREAFLLRQHRQLFLPKELLGEPAWDLLLLLYVMDDWEQMTVSKLVADTGVPTSTVLRWLGHLEQEGLVESRTHALDARIRLLRLTQLGLSTLDCFFAAMVKMEKSYG